MLKLLELIIYLEKKAIHIKVLLKQVFSSDDKELIDHLSKELQTLRTGQVEALRKVAKDLGYDLIRHITIEEIKFKQMIEDQNNKDYEDLISDEKLHEEL